MAGWTLRSQGRARGTNCAHIRVHRRKRDKARLRGRGGKQKIVSRCRVLRFHSRRGNDEPNVRQPLSAAQKLVDRAVRLHLKAVIIRHVVGGALCYLIGKYMSMYIDYFSCFRHR